ncbi:unnamed protein product, partial [marine sediment metagenome]
MRLETEAIKDLVKIEIQIKQMIQGQPIIYHPYYIIFGKEIYKLKKKHTSENLKKEVCILCCKWYSRGLDAECLNTISNFYLQMACFEISPPTGSVIMFGGAVAPTGYLLCNGAAVSRITYANLFAVTGTTFGVGNGTTTFNIPDFQGIFPRGAGTSTKLSKADTNAFAGVLGTYQNDKFQA